MAVNLSASQEDAVCQYFSPSSSTDGDGSIAHDRTVRTSDILCRYYLQGTCIFGQNCRYDHLVVDNENNIKCNSYDGYSAGLLCRSANCEDSDKLLATNEINSKQSRFNTLSGNTLRNGSSNTNILGPTPANWINAPEFVPKRTRSYADAVKSTSEIKEPEITTSEELCPLHIFGQCPNALQDNCHLIHGDVCELCQKACLHPGDEKQRKLHTELCEKELEQEMQYSFAVQRSLDKTCGICMDVVLEKEPLSERRFGILEKCNHVFCLSCIRKWRRSRHSKSDPDVDNVVDKVVTRTCPECRIVSDFVIPSVNFVDTEEEKKKLIVEYKEGLSRKPCIYFKQGEGTCPFGGACFYLHAKPDGTKVDLPLLTRRRRINQDGELDYASPLYLWDYLEFREENILINVDLVDIFSYSDSNDDSSNSCSQVESF